MARTRARRFWSPASAGWISRPASDGRPPLRYGPAPIMTGARRRLRVPTPCYGGVTERSPRGEDERDRAEIGAKYLTLHTKTGKETHRRSAAIGAASAFAALVPEHSVSEGSRIRDVPLRRLPAPVELRATKWQGSSLGGEGCARCSWGSCSSCPAAAPRVLAPSPRLPRHRRRRSAAAASRSPARRTIAGTGSPRRTATSRASSRGRRSAGRRESAPERRCSRRGSGGGARAPRPRRRPVVEPWRDPFAPGLGPWWVRAQ